MALSNVVKIIASQKPSSPAFNVVAVANLLKLNVSFEALDASKAVELHGPISRNAPAGKTITLTGTIPILRYLAKFDTETSSILGFTDAIKSSQIDYWLDFCKDSLVPDAGFNPLAAAFTTLNSHLSLRTFLVGYTVTLADLACWGALKSIPIFVNELKKEKEVGTHLTRWFNHLESLSYVSQAVADIAKAVVTANKSRKDQGSFEIGLKDAAPGKVVTRFPPEPSGYMHIGHAKAALLNEYFARRYEGKLILRFDDTNPSKEKAEFEESIKQDLELLGIKPDMVSHTSDHFDKMYELALVMIKKGKAYVDDSNQETMRAERMECIESKCRNLPVEENLRRFAEMTKGSEEGLKMCLRAKIDMKEKNGAMRDPVIYRCNLTPHHQTGTKWKLYPTYDFACPIVDSTEGVTHALRTTEYRDRNPQYEWFLRALDLRWVHIWEFGRVNFVYTLLSKRKLTWFVDEGLVTGWDDPRFPTVRGIRRRGLTIQGLRDYILSQGASQKILELEWDKIWAKNKTIIDPVAPRHTALAREKIAKIRVVDADRFEPYAKEMPKHKKNPDVGMKTTIFSPELYMEFNDAKTLKVGEEITLMDWGNVFVDNIEWSPDQSFVAMIDIRLNLQGDFKKTEKKITWLARSVPQPDQAPIRLVLHDYDYLITKKKIEEEEDVKDFVTPVSEFKTEAWGDANLKKCLKGDIIQLERKGYYIVDSPYDAKNPKNPVHLIFIPDGKAASTASKSDDKQTAAPANAAKSPAKNEKDASAPAPAPAVTNGAPAGVGVPMYESRAIYDKEPELPNVVGQMYEVKSFYGDAKSIPLYTGKPSKAAATPAAPAKGKGKAAAAVAPADGAPKPEEGEKKKKEKGGKGGAEPKAAPVEASIISKLDIVVGKIVEVSAHPDADSLFVEKIDVGESEPRTVVSGLRKFMTEDDLRGKTILVLKNLKPAAMRGIKSHAMVLCASNAEHTVVEFLVPPEGSLPGERVFFQGHEGEPEEQLNPKKKVFETVQPDFKTRDDLVAVWKDVEFRTHRGVVKASSLKQASIK
ncbi:hypothetical protein HDU76_000149 [Blyttiomyces sp. JEL0837]|nr:hypothetical protein HDU76_000149 [Blyttiomyces sp. JEL0837]